MNKTAKEFITEYKDFSGEWPDISDIVRSCQVSNEDAKHWLTQCRNLDRFMMQEKIKEEKKATKVQEVKKEVKKDVVKEEIKQSDNKPLKWWNKIPGIDELVIKFAFSLQYFGFIVAFFVDIGLAMFFFYSLATGSLGQIALAGLGLVQTTSKIWGWTYSRIDKKAFCVAILASVLSIFGNTAIFRAEIELQANTVKTENASVTSKQNEQTEIDVIQKQIKDKQDELTKKTTARDSLDLTVEKNLPMYNTLDGKVKTANNELTALNRQLTDAKANEKKTSQEIVIKPTEKPTDQEGIKLDAWSVFKQWTSLDISDLPKTLAYFFTLAFAFLLELIVFATTPRKGGKIKKR